MDNEFYLYARFKGSDASRHYTSNRNYLLRVLVNRFNGRVKINDTADSEGKIRYETKVAFEKSWKIIEDKTQYNSQQGKN